MPACHSVLLTFGLAQRMLAGGEAAVGTALRYKRRLQQRLKEELMAKAERCEPASSRWRCHVLREMACPDDCVRQRSADGACCPATILSLAILAAAQHARLHIHSTAHNKPAAHPRTRHANAAANFELELYPLGLLSC